MADLQETQRLVQAVQDLTKALGDMTPQVSKGFTDWQKSGEDSAKKVKASWLASMPIAEINKAVAASVDINKNKYHSMFEDLKLKAARVGTSIKDALGLGVLGGAAGGVAKSAMAGSLEGMVSSISGMLPAGGLFALMLMGRKQETKFDALGQQAAQAFKAVGIVGSDVAGKLAGDIKHLSTSGMAAERDITAVAGAFASMGISAKSATQATGIDLGVKGLRNSAINATLAMDKLYQLGSGTSAKMVGQVVVNSNLSLKESVQVYKDLSAASRESGLSQHAFTGAVTQASSALRIQGADVRSMGEALLITQKNYKQQGMEAQRAGDLAASGLGNITGAIKGMNMGMMGHIGQMLDPNLTGVQSVVRMERGMRGTAGQGEFFNQAMMKMVDVADKASGGKGGDELLFALERLFPQLGPEGADALVAIKKDMKDGVPLAKAAARHQDELKRAFQSEAQKMDALERVMQRVVTAIGDLGSSLLSVFILGMKELKETITYWFETLASLWRGSFFGSGDKQEEETHRALLGESFDRTMTNYGKQTITAFDQLVSSSSVVAKALGTAGNTVLRNALTTPSEMQKVIDSYGKKSSGTSASWPKSGEQQMSYSGADQLMSMPDGSGQIQITSTAKFIPGNPYLVELIPGNAIGR